jgi:phospholipid/cholesterol/gamma-HCH transport system substrate-binding protein
VAGLKAGTVKSMEINGARVAMDLAINTGVELPDDSRANIVVQTLLGKETVDLVSGSNRRMLRDGDTIPLSRTTTPVDITKLNDISVRLMNASDAQALNQLLEEVADITADKRSQVSQLVTGLGDVAAAVDSRRDQISSLLDALRTLSGTLAGRDKTIVSLIDNLDPVLSNLAARQKQIRTLLLATDSASHETADLVSRNHGVLDSLLRGLHQDLAILDRHQVDLAATVQYLNTSVHGYQSVGYSQGNFPNRWANIFVQSLGPIGVDAFLGQCGAVDQLIDQALGTDCRKTPSPHPTPTLPKPKPPTPTLPTPTVSLPVPLPSSGGLPTPTVSVPPLPGAAGPTALPGNIGDIVDGALAGTGGGGTS